MAGSLRSLTVPVLLLATLAAPARSTTIRVPADQPTIQAGIDAAAARDTVLVAPGTYTGEDNRDLDFHGRDIVVRSSAGPGSTTIDCEGAGRGFYLHSGETQAAVIQGFDISRGSADDPGGGGILCDGASPLIDDCHIAECRGYQSGGGVLLLNSEAKITNSSISTCNSDWRGGGMAIMGAGRVEIANCSFQENSARASGGGVYISDVDEVVVTHCSIVSNSAAESWDVGYGGGALIEARKILMTDCSIVANVAYTVGDDSEPWVYGGGVCAWGDSIVVTRCHFARNAARGVNYMDNNEARGGGAAIRAPYTLLEDCNFIENESEARYGFNSHAIAMGGGLYCETATLRSCTFDRNSAKSGEGRYEGSRAFGGGLYGDDVTLEGCVFIRNYVLAEVPDPAATGGGAALGAGAQVVQSTFCQNWAPTSGSGLYFHEAGLASVERSIIAFGGYSEAIVCNGTALSLSCTDLIGNDGGDWVGCVAPQAGLNGNLNADPLFCDLEWLDLGLAENSPCAPGNSPGQCGLIGAFPVSCGQIGMAELETPPMPEYVRVFPNPVDVASSLEWSASDTGSQQARIYDLAGRLVLSRDLGAFGPGTHQVAWADVVRGARLAAGVYFVRLGLGADARSARVVVMK